MYEGLIHGVTPTMEKDDGPLPPGEEGEDEDEDEGGDPDPSARSTQRRRQHDDDDDDDGATTGPPGARPSKRAKLSGRKELSGSKKSSRSKKSSSTGGKSHPSEGRKKRKAKSQTPGPEIEGHEEGQPFKALEIVREEDCRSRSPPSTIIPPAPVVSTPAIRDQMSTLPPPALDIPTPANSDQISSLLPPGPVIPTPVNSDQISSLLPPGPVIPPPANSDQISSLPPPGPVIPTPATGNRTPSPIQPPTPAAAGNWMPSPPISPILSAHMQSPPRPLTLVQHWNELHKLININALTLDSETFQHYDEQNTAIHADPKVARLWKECATAYKKDLAAWAEREHQNFGDELIPAEVMTIFLKKAPEHLGRDKYADKDITDFVTGVTRKLYQFPKRN